MVDEIHQVESVLLSLPLFILQKDPVNSASFLLVQAFACKRVEVGFEINEAFVIIWWQQSALDDTKNFSPDHRTTQLWGVKALVLSWETWEKLWFKNFKIDFKAQLLVCIVPISTGLIVLSFVAPVRSLFCLGLFYFSLLGPLGGKFSFNIHGQLIAVLGK